MSGVNDAMLLGVNIFGYFGFAGRSWFVGESLGKGKTSERRREKATTRPELVTEGQHAG